MLEATEEWRPVKGLEGRYEVSSMGRVRSLVDNHGNPRVRIRGLTLAPNGYLFLNLWKDGKAYVRKPHRLVAEAFLEKVDGADWVNHKNGDKTDNRVENLEWCTPSENVQHAIRTGLVVDPASHFKMKGRHGADHPTSKPVIQMTLDGEFIREYESGVEAARALGVRKGGVQRCAAGKRKTAFGYRWAYKNEGTETECLASKTATPATR